MPKLTNKDNLDKLAKALDARAKAAIKASVAEESARAQEVETTLQGQIADTLDMFGGKAIKYITQAQYNQLSDEEKNDPTIAYFITDAEDLSHSHSNKSLLDSFGSRTLTIGSKGKTFDGSANVSWTLAEIGAAEKSHTHDDRYYTESEINTKVTELKAEIDTDVKVETDRAIAAENALQAAIDGKSGSSHLHDDRYFTETEVTNKLSALQETLQGNIDTEVTRAKAVEQGLQTAVDGKAASGHLHDDRYFTESEMNTKLSTLKSDLQKEIDSDVLVETNRAKAEEQALQSAIDGKSPLGHAHDDRYLTEDEVENLADDLRLAIEAAVDIEEERAMAAEQGLQAKIDQKANVSHGNHVPTTETANNARFLRNDNSWQTITPANIGASATGHGHDDKYYTETEIDAKITTINTAINGKAPSSHTHDDRYYTETEINTKVTALQKEIDDDVKTLETSLQARIDQKSPIGHNHNDVYYTEVEIDDQMGDMLDAIDEAVTEEADRAKSVEASLDAAIKTKSDSGHLHDDRYYTKTTINTKVTELQSEIDADVKVETDRAKAAEVTLQANIDKKSNEGHNHDGRYYTETEIDGKIDALQEEIIDAVESEADRAKAAETTLQANIDKKANSGHTHDDRYYTETEINTKISNLQSEIDSDVLVETNRAKAAETTLQANIDKKADASHGNHVPATETANNAKFLRNDNTWQTVTPANIGASAEGHTHDGRYYTETEIDAKVTTINSSIATAKSDAQKYADTKIAALVDSAPEAMNTLNELATAISNHQGVYDAYVAEIDAKLATKSDTGHTHNYAGSSSAGGAATSANKVNSNLVIKLNSGTTEGTNMFTFNGSTAKTLNIKPDDIGAAKISHGTHVTYSTSTPLVAGTASIGTSEGLSRGDHVHPLQTSVSGNAGSATKLETARNINGTAFDGTQNITTANWGTSRNISISDSDGTNTGTAVSVNGSGNVTLKLPGTIKATLSGNSSTATKLASARTINGTSFDGSGNITTSSWGTARNISISDSDGTNTGTAVSVDGSAAATLKLPGTIKATLSGNASTATKLATARSINGTNFDGSGAITTTNWGTARNIQIGLTSKSVNGSAGVSWSLAEIGAEPAQPTVVAKTVSSGTLTLTKDKYQSATLATGNTIALPSVTDFTEINLFVKDCSIANVNLPDNCKWRVDPNLNAGTSFIFTFIYTGQEWLAEVKIYS